MDDKGVVYYPVHLTAEYEANKFADKFIHGPSYTSDYEKTKGNFAFKVTDTGEYLVSKDLMKLANVSSKCCFKNSVLLEL